MNKSIHCGTSVIGTLIFNCSTCDKQHFIYRRCGNRFCARCGYIETQKWANATLSKLANIKHHHIVFTIPHLLKRIAPYNYNIFHNILFQAAHQTIIDYFHDKHQLKPGIVSVLHTFSSDLKYHPHIHLIVTAGGQNQNQKLIELDRDFLTRQRYIANMFRKRFIRLLIRNIELGNINTTKTLFFNHRKINNWIQKAQKTQWIASIQKPLKDVFQIVGYVGRYTKRACISEYKITHIDNGRIKFVTNDYKNSVRGQKPKKRIIDLSYVQFLDRLLQHVPEKRYRMVRYAGIYNSYYLRKKKETVNNQKLDFDFHQHQLEILKFSHYRQFTLENSGQDPLVCPHCNSDLVFEKILFTRHKIFYDDS